MITILAFAGQLIAILTYLKTTAKQHSRDLTLLSDRINKQSETFAHPLESLEERIDKRFVEANQRMDTLRTEIDENGDDAATNEHGTGDDSTQPKPYRASQPA